MSTTAPTDPAGATLAIGGRGGADNVIDGRRANVPLHLTFEGGHDTIHIDEKTLAAACNTKLANLANLKGITFGTTSSQASSTQFVSAALGSPDKKYPLHTLGRVAHISSIESSRPGVSATTASHHVIPPGSWSREPIRHDFHNLTGVFGDDHPSSRHIHELDAATQEMQTKQALNWESSIGATTEDAMHGCVTAEQDGVKRTSIPIDANISDDGSRGQLAALVSRHAANLGDLLGDHHVTAPLLNSITGKTTPHVVTTHACAEEAATSLVANLQRGTAAHGLTFTCKDRSRAAPDGRVDCAVILHREVPTVEGLADGQPLLVAGAVRGAGGTLAAPLGSANSNMAAAMFAGSVKLKKKSGTNAKAAVAAKIPDVVQIHEASGGDTN